MEIEELLTDLLSYSKWYQILLKGNSSDRALNASIKRLNHLGTTVARPFFLEILRLQSEAKLNTEEVLKIFLATEAYVFRRAICELPTNALNKVFLALHKEIIKYDGTDDDYLAKFHYTLLSKRESARFPKDDEFISEFESRQIYLMNRKNQTYILERFENSGTLEDKDIYRHIEDGSYSIEHIMPQHLTPAWIKSLGDNYNEIHEKWKHRMANLTLTAYNSKYSNSTFDEKKTMKNGFSESGIRLNQYVAQQSEWTEKQLEERCNHLMKMALGIWSSPVTDFVPASKQLASCSLNDEIDLSGRNIVRFGYKNIEQPVKSWIEMYEQIIRMLYQEDKSVLTKLVYSTEDSAGLKSYISSNPADLRFSSNIDDEIYLEKNTSTNTKIFLLRKFFELYGIDPTELTFYFPEEAEPGIPDLTPGTADELRHRYWTYALENFHDTYGNEMFLYTHPTKGNWISSSFGVGGFSINCVANLDSARVELYLGKPQASENKAAYDLLSSYRSEIENEIGSPLIWERGEQTKSSRIFIELSDVHLDQESCWPEISKFHAEWSRKFFDVIIAYLK